MICSWLHLLKSWSLLKTRGDSTLLNPFIYKGFKKKVEESRGEMEKEEEGGKKKVDGNWAIRIFLD